MGLYDSVRKLSRDNEHVNELAQLPKWELERYEQILDKAFPDKKKLEVNFFYSLISPIFPKEELTLKEAVAWVGKTDRRLGQLINSG